MSETETAILSWFESTWPGEFTRSTAWTFTILETFHFIGLCILFGAIAIFDLRVLGFAKRIPFDAAMKLIPVAIGGFAINLVTGIWFFCIDPFRYWPNIGFRIKMILIVLAGLNTLWFELAERRRLEALPGDADADFQAKLIAGSSLVLWTAVIVLGRLIPYVGTG